MAKTPSGTKITLVMTTAVLAAFGIIMLMNMAALIGFVPSRYLSPNDVRGIAVEHNDMLYTLNFDQQNTLVDIFNRAIPVTKESAETRKVKDAPPSEVKKIVIYRFNAPDIEIIPVSFVSKSQSAVQAQDKQRLNLVFLAPLWNNKGFLEESVGDELHKFLSTTYDQ
jgi:hypothetical protein